MSAISPALPTRTEWPLPSRGRVGMYCLIAAETANSVTLKRAEEVTDTVERSEIEQLRSTGLSIMPEGLEKQIDPAAMADLLAYLSNAL